MTGDPRDDRTTGELIDSLCDEVALGHADVAAEWLSRATGADVSDECVQRCLQISALYLTAADYVLTYRHELRDQVSALAGACAERGESPWAALGDVSLDHAAYTRREGDAHFCEDARDYLNAPERGKEGGAAIRELAAGLGKEPGFPRRAWPQRPVARGA